MTTGVRPAGPAPGSGAGMRVAVVGARFNIEITERLVDGATKELDELGAAATTLWVPGAFELPLAAHRLASSGQYDAVVCLGAVIRGETDHYVHVATQCAAGLQRAQLDTGVPVIFGERELKATNDQHRLIVQALIDRDEDAADRAARGHVEATMAIVEPALQL